MSLYEEIGTNNPAYLLAKAEGAVTAAVNMVPGNGTVKRGTVIYKTANGMWAACDAANAVITNQLAVLDETVDTTGEALDSKTVAAVARAFTAGTFVAGKVTLANDAAVTAAAAVVLREQGICFAQMVGGAEFNNAV